MFISVSLFIILLGGAAINAQTTTPGSCTPTAPCPAGQCCSQWGFCGTGTAYCGTATGVPSTSTPQTVPPTTAAPTPSTSTSGSCASSRDCTSGMCCSQWGFCGSGPSYCGTPTAVQTSAPTVTSAPTTQPTSPVASTTNAPPNSWPGSSPVKAIYIDVITSWDAQGSNIKAAIDAGYNLILLAFFIPKYGGAQDIASYWAGLDDATKQSLVQYAHNNNARIVVSWGGDQQRDYDTLNAANEGTRVANWAVAQHLDGVDFDIELDAGEHGFVYNSMSASSLIQWIADITNAARSVLGNSALITHAPQAPYFGPTSGGQADSSAGSLGGYTAVYNKAPSINFFLVQFYNQDACYQTYSSLFITSGCWSTGTSVKEISTYGIPLSKIVVGKPVLSSDAGSGYIAPATLNAWFAQANTDIGWHTGIMGWQWHDSTTNSNWLHAIYP